jgi:hypothetical protein
VTVSIAVLAAALDPDLISTFSDGSFNILHRFILLQRTKRAGGHYAADPLVQLPASGLAPGGAVGALACDPDG